MSAPVFTLVGGLTALIEAGGFRLLTDPTFDAPGGESPWSSGNSSHRLIALPQQGRSRCARSSQTELQSKIGYLSQSASPEREADRAQ